MYVYEEGKFKNVAYVSLFVLFKSSWDSLLCFFLTIFYFGFACCSGVS